MNNSAQAIASNTKDFSGTICLKTGVDIPARLMVTGYSEFWTRVFRELDLDMESASASSLLAHDKKENKKRKRNTSKKCKLVQRKDYTNSSKSTKRKCMM